MKNWFRKYWWTVFIVFIVIVGFAITIYTLKTPTDFGYTPNIADLIFDFLDKWASAGAPVIMLIGIITALIIGIISLQQTKDIRSKQYRYTLLKEIIEWATSVAACGLEKGIFDETIPIPEDNASLLLDDLIGELPAFRLARARSVYISNIASDLDAELKKNVDDLINKLRKQIEILMGYKRNRPTQVQASDIKYIAGKNEELYNLATIVADKAAEIQRREIPLK